MKPHSLLEFEHEIHPSNARHRIYLAGEADTGLSTGPSSFLISVLSHSSHWPSNQNGSHPLPFVKLSLPFPAPCSAFLLKSCGIAYGTEHTLPGTDQSFITHSFNVLNFYYIPGSVLQRCAIASLLSRSSRSSWGTGGLITGQI